MSSRKRKQISLPLAESEAVPTKKRKTLAEELAAFTNPTPKDVDAEEPHWDYSINYEADHESLASQASSKLSSVPSRSRMVSATPDDLGASYRGKKITRETLPDREELMEEFVPRGDDFSDDDMDDDDDSMDDDDDKTAIPVSTKQSEADRLERMMAQQTEDDDEDEDDEGGARLTKESDTSLESTRNKASHTLNQRILWDSFVDVRLGMQPLMEMAYRLPDSRDYKEFLQLSKKTDGDSRWAESDGAKLKASVNEASSLLRDMLRKLCKIQSGLSAQLPAVQADDPKNGANDSSKHDSQSDKISWESMAREYRNLMAGSGPIIDKWQSKTLLSSGGINFTKFKQINQSIMGQVEAMMSLEGHARQSRMRKSQTRQINPNDRAFGQKFEIPTNPEGIEDNAATKKKDIIDEEIFNDWDFLETLVKEQIESGAFKFHNNQAAGEAWENQQYLNLQRLRRRKRQGSKQVDRKASKGRKIRYKVHEKLVSFMAPHTDLYPAQDTPMADALFNSLFGGEQSSRDVLVQ